MLIKSLSGPWSNRLTFRSSPLRASSFPLLSTKEYLRGPHLSYPSPNSLLAESVGPSYLLAMNDSRSAGSRSNTSREPSSLMIVSSHGFFMTRLISADAVTLKKSFVP